MTNIINFNKKTKRKSNKNSDSYQGMSEEEYALIVFKLTKLEKKIQNEIMVQAHWINEPNDLQTTLNRMEHVYYCLSNIQNNNAFPKPYEEPRVSLWDKIKELFG